MVDLLPGTAAVLRPVERPGRRPLPGDGPPGRGRRQRGLQGLGHPPRPGRRPQGAPPEPGREDGRRPAVPARAAGGHAAVSSQHRQDLRRQPGRYPALLRHGVRRGHGPRPLRAHQRAAADRAGLRSSPPGRPRVCSTPTSSAWSTATSSRPTCSCSTRPCRASTATRPTARCAAAPTRRSRSSTGAWPACCPGPARPRTRTARRKRACCWAPPTTLPPSRPRTPASWTRGPTSTAWDAPFTIS